MRGVKSLELRNPAQFYPGSSKRFLSQEETSYRWIYSCWWHLGHHSPQGVGAVQGFRGRSPRFTLALLEPLYKPALWQPLVPCCLTVLAGDFRSTELHSFIPPTLFPCD